MGHHRRPGRQTARLLPGAAAFFMADDFHGTTEWGVFEESMHRVFPDRPIVDIEDADPIVHTVYDLDDKIQIPGQAHLRQGYKGGSDGRGGATGERDFRRPWPRHDRGLLQPDIGDAWEYADDPYYPREIHRPGNPNRE